VEADAGATPARNGVHLRGDVEPIRGVPALEVHEVRTAPAGDIQERVAGRLLAGLDDGVDALRFSVVILKAVQRVVERGGFVVHSAILRPAQLSPDQRVHPCYRLLHREVKTTAARRPGWTGADERTPAPLPRGE
jgi:hypothetical protein